MSGPKFRTDMNFVYGEPLEVAPGVRRIVANNPSVFTFKGTNTYILGTDTLAVIDPGPEDDAHFDAIMAAAGGRPISHILITHTHRDHVDSLPRLADETGAKIYGYGRKSRTEGETKVSPNGTEFVDESFSPDVVVRDGDEIGGEGWHVEALFTPGHAPDHLCFAMPEHNLVFSGDHVMGWNTSVVAPPEGNMQDYLASLERMIKRTDNLYFPGHGGPHRGARTRRQGLPDPPALARTGDLRSYTRRQQHDRGDRRADLPRHRPASRPRRIHVGAGPHREPGCARAHSHRDRYAPTLDSELYPV